MILETTVTDLFKRYHDFIAIPSVSVEKRGIEEAVAYLTKTFQRLGADQVDVWREEGNPVVFADFKGASETTLLIYNHYDVQPAGNSHEWQTPPFEATHVAGKVYGRGVSDCKGEIIARLIAIELLRQAGELPCRIKFMIEGEEEIGSRHLGTSLASHRHELVADACLWECGWKNEEEHLELACGVKGLLSFDLVARTASQAIHSSLACYIDNAAWRLTSALATLKDRRGEITIPGFHEGIRVLDAETRASVNELDFNEAAIRAQYHLTTAFVTDAPKEALVNGPTLNISQLKAGHEMSNHSIPAVASAKIDCRFVPDQEPSALLKLIRRHLDKEGFQDVEIRGAHYEGAYRSDSSTGFIQDAFEIAKGVYGEGMVKLIPNFAGGGPMALFGQQLKLPILAAGCSYAQSNVHGPNEHIRMADVAQNVTYLMALLKKSASQRLSQLLNEGLMLN